MKSIYQILLIGSLLAGIAACENETKVCDQTLSTNLHINFKRDSAGIVRDTIMPKVTAFALGHDSIYKVQPLSNVFFQLSPVADTSRFYLKVDSTLTPDTLTFRYKRTTHFISAGCGFGTYFLLDTVIATRHTIDSVQINIKSVTTSNDTHLTLYFFNQ
ncbi:hypothetical protein CLV51_1011179 [Chitinophaga niastensis]|uniref:Calcium-binding protein P n=1 Tax=Chitinophaga niastensis TaxID=536980 RepID=A0A2P8HUG2_CHINA|nr:DUF6452 family protein [Chitinophaga niastensis]PSL49842.1 hypothetical protein CLV51_1011179 [Chitinophaga niastensis]